MKKQLIGLLVGLTFGVVGFSGMQAQAATLWETGTDLMPSTTLLHQSPDYYAQNKAILTKQYNLVGDVARFHNNQIQVYVTQSKLRPFIQTAMTTWNHALGQTVFEFGTATAHQLTVTTKPSQDWDGLITGNIIYLNSTHLQNATYVDEVANTATTRRLTADYLAQKARYNATTGHARQVAYASATQYYQKLVTAERAAAPTYQAFWSGTMTHEFGHALGLDHTPYLTDRMYAPASSGNVSSPVAGKYTWTGPKDPADTQRQSSSLSVRDVRRAELSQLLGYW